LPERIPDLFAEYADAHARGDRPRADEYLARAGGRADQLAGLLERFVRAPAREPDAETIVLTEAMLTGESPLVGLRARKGVRADDVVDALVKRLGLDPSRRAKVKRYYERLERGLLEPTRVSRRVGGGCRGSARRHRVTSALAAVGGRDLRCLLPRRDSARGRRQRLRVRDPKRKMRWTLFLGECEY
jgi:hypothetical protein